MKAAVRKIAAPTASCHSSRRRKYWERSRLSSARMASRMILTLVASWLRWEMEVMRGIVPVAVAVVEEEEKEEAPPWVDVPG